MLPRPRPVPAEPASARIVLRIAQAKIDHIWRTDHAFDLKRDMHADVLVWVGWELDRLAARRRMSYLARRVQR